MSPRSDLILYHGGHAEVSRPDLAGCAKFKDFGQGLCLTSSRSQARSLARLSTQRALDRGLPSVATHKGYVSTFIFDNTTFCDLRELESAGATPEWLECVACHRRPRSHTGLFKTLAVNDVIAGKIADDQTNITLTLYMDGVFVEVGSEKAMSTCIDQLLPNRLKDQFCFRSKRALSCLRFEGSEVVWM